MKNSLALLSLLAIFGAGCSSTPLDAPADPSGSNYYGTDGTDDTNGTDGTNGTMHPAHTNRSRTDTARSSTLCPSHNALLLFIIKIAYAGQLKRYADLRAPL